MRMYDKKWWLLKSGNKKWDGYNCTCESYSKKVRFSFLLTSVRRVNRLDGSSRTMRICLPLSFTVIKTSMSVQ